MKKLMAVMAVLSLFGSAQAVSKVERIITSEHPLLISDQWGGGHRMVFEFEGRKAWVVEPEKPTDLTKSKDGMPWVWTMQWMGAYLDRTTAPDLVRMGYHHVHLEAFDTKANAQGLKALASFQKYLVDKLGFAKKAELIGMSWGGFYSIRYATAFPQNVSCIYLDAPLLTFWQRERDVGPWVNEPPKDGSWEKDSRMPVNMAEQLAKTGIPIMLLYGGQDQTVNPKVNCETFAPRFKAAGGQISVECREAYGHHPHGVEAWDKQKLIDFFLKNK